MDNSIEINRKIAKNLTYYRKAAGYTQAELAEKINYSDKSVSKWESGNGVPDIYTLIQLAELYGVSVDVLIGDGKAPVALEKKRMESREETYRPLYVVNLIREMINMWSEKTNSKELRATSFFFCSCGIVT